MRAEGFSRLQVAEAALSVYQADLEEFLAGLTVRSVDGGGKTASTSQARLTLVK